MECFAISYILWSSNTFSIPVSRYGVGVEDPYASSQADGIHLSTGSLMSETKTKCELYSAVQTHVTDNNAATRLTWEDKADIGNRRDNN